MFFVLDNHAKALMIGQSSMMGARDMWSSNQVVHIESVETARVQLEHVFLWDARGEGTFDGLKIKEAWRVLM